jgi:tRNA (guanine37-N1)-methyltransferase
VRFDVVTIFPGCLAPLREALLGRAVEAGLVDLAVHDLRAWTHDVHQAVDDAPYGGGPGMVMKPQVWGEALDAVLAADPRPARLVVPTPAGMPFTQVTARAWATEPRLVFACGRYEGIDQRVVDHYAGLLPVDEVSIGDYVLVGGEVAVLAMVEAVARLLPGVLGNPRSAAEDSFSDGLLEGPAYTRPPTWRGRAVPPVLRSGDHAAVGRWRRDQALERTATRRPDLLAALPADALDQVDRAVLEQVANQPMSSPSDASGTMERMLAAGPCESPHPAQAPPIGAVPPYDGEP